MSRLYLVGDGALIAERRKHVPPGRLVEAWPDLYSPGDFWLGETSKALLDAPDAPLPFRRQVDGERVPIYYGPRLADVESLPAEESLRSRVLSARGMAVAWITIDASGDRTLHEPQSPRDPIFYLRRPAGHAAHVWRLFHSRAEARAYVAEAFARDAEAAAWAEALTVDSYDALMDRHSLPGP